MARLKSSRTERPGSMGVRLETANAMPDVAKWIGVLVLFVGAIVAFYFFADYPLLVRVVGLLLAIGAAAYIAVQTEKGRSAWEFVRESRTEVRKVVWPTRKETMQTTGLVIVMVAVVALILWMLDSLLGWTVRLLLGQGG